MRLTFSLARVKLKTASGDRLADCYQSWLNSRGSYTPLEPINSPSENKLRHRQGIKIETRAQTRIEREIERTFKRANKANFPCFPEALENHFSKCRVLIP